MKIWSSAYQLKPVQRLNSLSHGDDRRGALLRVEFPELGSYGHADIHPWIELGDDPLEIQLEKLKAGKLTPLTKQSLTLAKLEAQARAENRSLYPLDVHLKNNFILTDAVNFKVSELNQICAHGFETIKMKAGFFPTPEFAIIKEAQKLGLKVRLDFNAKPSKINFDEYFKHFSASLLSTIEYVEDPFIYDLASWSRLNSQVPVAIDNELKSFKGFENSARSEQVQKSPFSVLVIKPAKMDVEQTLEEYSKHSIQATVTSYMDHPVGVLHAWAQALNAKKKSPSVVLQSGCATHELYQQDEFSDLIQLKEARLVPPQGRGLGLDSVLENLAWQKLQS